jgi:hypothetical protein
MKPRTPLRHRRQARGSDAVLNRGIFWLLLPFILGYVLMVRVERDHARHQLAAMTARGEGAEVTRDRWLAGAKECSDAAERAAADAEKADAAERVREKRAAAIAKSAARQAAQRVLELHAVAIPQTCADAVRWGNAEAAELGQW